MTTGLYLTDMVDRFWRFRELRYCDQSEHFDQATRQGDRPPVFTKQNAAQNVLIDPALSEAHAREVIKMLPHWERHRWFRSMKSSQAIVQSIFGNLRAMRKCHLLRPIATEESLRPFESVEADGASLGLERKVAMLQEPRPTSIDLYVDAFPRVAIECKLTEADVGHCSRPRLSENEPDYCDGSYRHQNERAGAHCRPLASDIGN